MFNIKKLTAKRMNRTYESRAIAIKVGEEIDLDFIMLVYENNNQVQKSSTDVIL